MPIQDFHQGQIKMEAVKKRVFFFICLDEWVSELTRSQVGLKAQYRDDKIGF